ncbi:tubulin nucleotide-binding domain-like protein [Gymnopus androsaceus JB14]|uniref:Tubulin nucleotide-binding domain-like protein n=1 Tax=Gymnopus androsaceus JB14 TaxID=1447944 RepID=A0A6A4IDW2_9AGAR|nr:tubulin nucleotide-binding domain-like protein [Gymnopus androsaceus JB14]
MREILYVQAGNLANYVGTHFWNTQESYFTYAEDEEEALVVHDTSFREGETSKGDPTYCPRLISFDRKCVFNPLYYASGLTKNDSKLWQGKISEHEHEPIEPHIYQTHLEAGQDDNGIPLADANPVRYWSDFNRVFYIPRTAQMLPDVPEWQTTEGDWALGQETFKRFNDETELMEGSVRLFIEECSSFQGLQLMNDTSTFGAFSYSFLMAFYDELSRAPCLSFPLMGDAVPRNTNLENTIHFRKVVNDAVYLRELDNLSILAIPILSPKTWSRKELDLNLNFDGSNYHTSSIISAHIENSTSPLRLKVRQEDISSFSNQLNFYGPHRFSQLSGVFPVAADSTPQTFWQQFELSSATTYYARKDITRGFLPSTLHAYDLWYSEMSIKDPLAMSIHAPGYPLPSSFPDIFNDQGILWDYRQQNTKGKTPPSASMFTTLANCSGTAGMFADYAKFIQACVDRRKPGVLTGLIENLDDMKQLVNDLWKIHDGYSTDTLQSEEFSLEEF